MDGAVGTEQSGRPRRTKRQSQKAQEILESGESIPGLLSPDTPPRLSSPNMPGSGMRSHLPASASSHRMSAPRSGFGSRETGEVSLPSFAADDFLIYNWKIPRPKSFINLPPSYREWKRETDRQERKRDIDDGSDDWSEFCGDPAMYPDRRTDGSAMCHSIARTFVNRAKRAFWAGKRWREFEVQERTVDSESQARAEQDPKKRAVLLETALDNGLRLAVFDALKVRLCEEIWLQPYRVSESVSQPAPAREDSKMPTPIPNMHQDVERFRRRRTPTIEEMGRGITDWSIDQYGVAQPLYGNETEPPSGMRNFMRDMREQARIEREESGQRWPSSATQRARIGNIGVNRIIPMTAAEEIAGREPDFDTSDEGED